MWDVQLGYTTHNDGPQHWELVFRYDGKADDDSMDCECPDCDCQVKCECPPCNCQKDCRCPPCECDCPCPPCDCEEDDCPCPPCDCEVVCQCPPCNCEVLCQCPPCNCPVDHQCADWPNCPCGQFDGDNFEYDEDDETFTAKSIIHICHMRINSRTGDRDFELKWLDRESSLIKCTSTFGTFTNQQLAMVESICANVDIPEKGYGDCQSWVRDALEQIDSQGAADLDEDYEHTLNYIALNHNRCGLCGEESDSDDEPQSASAEESDEASGQDSGREDDTKSEQESDKELDKSDKELDNQSGKESDRESDRVSDGESDRKSDRGSVQESDKENDDLDEESDQESRQESDAGSGNETA